MSETTIKGAEMNTTVIRQKHILSQKHDTCDICHQAIQPGEKYTDDGDEVAHIDCTRNWFHSNFGREGLR